MERLPAPDGIAPQQGVHAVDLFRRLACAVADGTYAPGAKVPHQLLGEAFGVSGSSVRVAVQRLGRVGLIEVYANHWSMISEVTEERTREAREFAVSQGGAILDGATRGLSINDRHHARGLAGLVIERVHAGTGWTDAYIDLLLFLTDRASSYVDQLFVRDFWYRLARDLHSGDHGAALGSALTELHAALGTDDEERRVQAVHRLLAVGA